MPGRGLPGSLDGLGPVDVAELAQAEAIPTGGVHIAVHRHDGAGGGHLERLPHLHVHLKVGDGAPVVRGWGNESFGISCVCHSNHLIRL